MEIVLKALIGGALVVAFALLAETLSPKRFAGVFAAAPTIAVGSLVITVAYSGSLDARRACTGMVAGAAGFIAYRLRCDPAKLREVKPREALIRFGFGAGTSAVAGLVSGWAGPFVGVPSWRSPRFCLPA